MAGNLAHYNMGPSLAVRRWEVSVSVCCCCWLTVSDCMGKYLQTSMIYATRGPFSTALFYFLCKRFTEAGLPIVLIFFCGGKTSTQLGTTNPGGSGIEKMKWVCPKVMDSGQVDEDVT